MARPLSRLTSRALVLILGTTAALVALPKTPAVAADTYVGAVIGTRGTSLGSASYTPPAGAVYASNAGSDTNPGSLSSPVKTVARALALAPSGGTVVLRAGTYHESVTVTKQVTIQNYPREVVWFDGSRAVSNWTKSGTVWVAPWSTFFASSGGATRPGYPYAPYPAQVFIDGAALAQVGSLAEVKVGTFFADSANKRLVIGSDPTSKRVVSSDLTRAIGIMTTNVNLKGFGVRRYAVTAASRAAILMDPDGGTFERLVVSDNAYIGLALSGSNKTIRNLTVERNGLMGLGMDRADNVVVTNSIFGQNNFERFPTLPVAAGVKITKAAKARITNNLFSANYLSAGLWFDNYSSDVLIANNSMVNNGEQGINLEAATRGIVANNDVIGSRKGIELRDTDTVKVMNNHVRGYTLFGVYLAQDDRWTNRPSNAPATHSLLVKNNTVANNVLACGARFQIFGKDDHTGIPMADFDSTITGNLFSQYRQSPELNMVGWGAPVSGGTEFLQSTAALAKKGSGWTNLQSSACVTNPESSVDLSTQTTAAMAIPSDVASLIGVSAGTKKIGLVNTTTAPVTTVAPPTTTSGVLDSDAFNRTLSGTWGSSDGGNPWSLSGGSSAFSVTGGYGMVSLNPADNRVATLPKIATTSTSTTTTVAVGSLPTAGAASVTVIGRQVSGSVYSARVRVGADGSARLLLLRDETQLGAAYGLAQKYVAGQQLNVKLQVSGAAPTTVRAKIWAAGQPEPSAWTLTAQDSTAVLQSAGTVGIKAYLSGTASSNVKVRVASFTVVKP
ncbi:right-handed parallel beta-helix repeat-containing protein [Aestuariimicrobium sp. T2.26MG-19.2B]|uniref:right-handed parallel beta-helix repeat-containing protein n=1 Tax=Aestuariimicrobium sp. T2.26MG-19.2B TaxID=3040679 RepID=UPI002477AF28|nr:right-handed parallel beta-helix repeat-containing protein [Aestuariimicrobium sp. T2.26MG-19.2B]CAI9406234.1 hypothetical protein AESSP_01584 [Aestuariimicrobium sp. T2.26MG-19.2B]